MDISIIEYCILDIFMLMVNVTTLKFISMDAKECGILLLLIQKGYTVIASTCRDCENTDNTIHIIVNRPL